MLLRTMARWTGLRRGLRFARDCRGVAAAEMALVFPVVGFVMLNVVDFAVFAYSKMQVDLAATQAVGLARSLCTTPSAANCAVTYASQMTSAAQQTTLGSGVSLDVPPTEEYYCADAANTLVLVATPPVAPPANCDAVISGSTAKPGSYIRATASYPYSPIFPGVSVASVLPATIESTAWMRLQ